MPSTQTTRQLRVLVAIASYGVKNLAFLKRIIESYRSMAMDADVVVLSEAPKDLGPNVRVVVGLPSRNPWTLPFAHKTVFAENVDRYNLFIYSEDDIEASEPNIQAFLRVLPAMAPDEIPGYLRYEIGPDQSKLMTDAHKGFHWKPESVKRRGDYTIAEFSNEHAGFYILTQTQLRKAIASGGFLRSPYQGRYGLPETAATDPYTGCGFRKVICISALEDFFIHHMSNAYVGRHGLPFAVFNQQVQTLMDIRDGRHPASTLCETETKILHGRWSKYCSEEASEDVLALVQAAAKNILSVGCGSGDTEARLKARGAQVTALPIDSVLGAAAARRGIEVIYGTFDEGSQKLGGRKFDCVLVSNLLHLQREPGRFLEQCARFVREGGTLVISGPNFNRLPTFLRRMLDAGDYRKLRNYDQSGISVCGPDTLARHIGDAGLRVDTMQWINHAPVRWGGVEIRRRFGRFTAHDWILRARR